MQPILDADRPISSCGDDLLERGSLVEQLAQWIGVAPLDTGLVLGVTGAWGTGKTSILRLLEEWLGDDVAVVWFEPWLFSGADQLVPRFFDEVAGQLARRPAERLKDLATRMAEYGAALSPLLGSLVGFDGGVVTAAADLRSLGRGSVRQQREELQATLAAQGQRIVVLIDDIDRLDASEVREVLRLVKLVADLPGVVHVLSYDRVRVEQALQQTGQTDGRAYLEKIVQASLTVPAVSSAQLRSLTLDWLEAARGDRTLVSWNAEAWSNLVDGGIDRYLVTLRDGRRLANTAPAALELCSDEVASMDAIALEAVRVFDPDVHERLLALADLLTGSRQTLDFRGSDQIEAEARQRVEALFASSHHPDATRKVLRELFPAAGHLLGGSRHASLEGWRTAKRVASSPVLMRYLHLRLASSEAASAVVDEALAALADASRFRSVVARVDDERLRDLLARVRARISEQTAPDVVGCALVALALVPRIPRGSGFLDVEPSRYVVWFVEDLIETIEPTAARADTARQLVEQAPTLSLQVELLYRFRLPPDGPSKEPKLDLLEGVAYDELRRTIADAIETTTADELARQDFLLWLMELLRDEAGPNAVLVRLREEPVLLAVLTSAGTRVRPVTDGRISLHLEPLVELAGHEVVEPLKRLSGEAESLPEDLRAPLTAALERLENDDSTEP